MSERTTTKDCTKCGLEKRRGDFYADSRKADGLMCICKECHKDGMRAVRQARADYYREFDRQRVNRPERVALRAAYRTTARGQERVAVGRKKWSERNPEKRAAHITVGNAVRNGRLIKRPCEVCGNPEVEAHHDDYSKPLKVRWLCTEHHIGHHVEVRRAEIPAPLIMGEE
jgi:hypothetical protein